METSVAEGTSTTHDRQQDRRRDISNRRTTATAHTIGSTNIGQHQGQQRWQWKEKLHAATDAAANTVAAVYFKKSII
jgi:hypothetical protein